MAITSTPAYEPQSRMELLKNSSLLLLSQPDDWIEEAAKAKQIRHNRDEFIRKIRETEQQKR